MLRYSNSSIDFIDIDAESQVGSFSGPPHDLIHPELRE